MMGYGKALGTLDWRTDVIYLMGSDKSIITPETRKQMVDAMMNGEGIAKDNDNEVSHVDETEGN
jgi:hypothetical protein